MTASTFLSTFRNLRWRDVWRCAVIPLLGSWLVALAFGLLIARIQYTEVASAFSPAQVGSEYQNRINRELLHGLLLFMPQVGLLAALLVWQIGGIARSARSTPNLNLSAYGAALGLLLGLVESAIMVIFEVPILYILCLLAIVIGAGWFAGWIYQTQS